MDIGYNTDTYKFVVTSNDGFVLATLNDVFLAEKISKMFDEIDEKMKIRDKKDGYK